MVTSDFFTQLVKGVAFITTSTKANEDSQYFQVEETSLHFTLVSVSVDWESFENSEEEVEVHLRAVLVSVATSDASSVNDAPRNDVIKYLVHGFVGLLVVNVALEDVISVELTVVIVYVVVEDVAKDVFFAG